MRYISILALLVSIVASISAQVVPIKLDIWIQASTLNVVPAINPNSHLPYPLGIAMGDGRGPGQSGSSRLTHTVDLNLSTLSYTIHSPQVSPSTTVYPAVPAANLPADVVTATADTSSVSVVVTRMGTDMISVRFRGNPSNPTVEAAPGITYDITVLYNRQNGVWNVGFTTDQFPSYRLTVDGQEKLVLNERNPYYLIPLLPDQSGVTSSSGPFSIPGSVFGNGAFNYSSFQAFVDGPGSFGWDRPSSDPGARINYTIRVISYQDSSSGAWYSWE